MHVYMRHMYIAVYLRYHVSLLVNINIFYMTPQRATWKNSYYMLNVLPSLNKVLLLLLLLLDTKVVFQRRLRVKIRLLVFWLFPAQWMRLMVIEIFCYFSKYT